MSKQPAKPQISAPIWGIPNMLNSITPIIDRRRSGQREVLSPICWKFVLVRFVTPIHCDRVWPTVVYSVKDCKQIKKISSFYLKVLIKKTTDFFKKFYAKYFTEPMTVTLGHNVKSHKTQKSFVHE